MCDQTDKFVKTSVGRFRIPIFSRLLEEYGGNGANAVVGAIPGDDGMGDSRGRSDERFMADLYRQYTRLMYESTDRMTALTLRGVKQT